MIQIKPLSFLTAKSPVTGANLIVKELVWQGLHICADGRDELTGDEWLVDLPVGQGFVTPTAINKNSRELFPAGMSKTNWYGGILLQMLDGKQNEIKVRKQGNCKQKRIFVLNTVDAWYGHSLLFLFHIEKLKKLLPNDTGLVIIIQPFLEWMIPSYVDEYWIADIPLKKGTNYYKLLNSFINSELERFDEVFLSQAPVQSHSVNIYSFTGCKKFSPTTPPDLPLITFIWREDVSRLWCKSWLVSGGLRYFKLQKIFLPIHLWRVKRCMKLIKKRLGNNYGYAVAGLGQYGKFSNNITDLRVNGFTKEDEVKICKIYASSVLAIGVHGSSMILPSGLAGATISLMPPKRWGNFAQDILYDENQNVLMEIFNKRVLPLKMSMREIADIAAHIVKFREGFELRFIDHAKYL